MQGGGITPFFMMFAAKTHELFLCDTPILGIYIWNIDTFQNNCYTLCTTFL